MWRVLGVINRMGETLTEAGSQLSAVVQAIDDETARLQERLDNDATALKELLDRLHIPQHQEEAVRDIVLRIETTARQVAWFSHPRPEDAEEQIDRLLRMPPANAVDVAAQGEHSFPHDPLPGLRSSE